MIANYQEYTEDKKKFFEKHDYDYHVETSPMDEYGVYRKTYIFEDNATWYEVMSPVHESVEVEVNRVKVKIEVKMLRTEYWNNEAGSKCYYEKF